jgi:hypothetical protein
MAHREAAVKFNERIMIIVILLFIPVGAMTWVYEHNRQNDIRDQDALIVHATALSLWAVYDNTMSACERGNVLRRKSQQNSRALRQLGFQVDPIPLVRCESVVIAPSLPRPDGTADLSKGES